MSEKLPVRLVAVAADTAGQRLDNWLLYQLKGLPRSAVYRLLRRGEVRVNGGRRKAEYRLQEGDTVRIPPVTLPPVDAPAAIPMAVQQQLADAVIFADDDYLVVNKPSGLAVHGGSGVNFGVIEVLREYTGIAKLELAHRIDRDTSGLLLMAKKRSALLLAHDAFRQGNVRKRYITYVVGRWPRKLQHVQIPLERYLTASGERRVRVSAEGKPSRTDVTVLAQEGEVSELAVFPRTGRTHQIRVHCLANSHVVVGDTKYAPDDLQSQWRRQGVTRLCLHAQRLRVQLGGLYLDVQAPVADDMLACWQALARA